MNKSISTPFWRDFSFWAIVFVCLIIASQVIKFGLPANVFTWDTWGYYLYLPQTFIEGDPAISDYSSIEYVIANYNPNNSSHLYQIHPLENGNFINQYWCGVSVLCFPFFLVGHFFAWLLNYPMDGYSSPYQLAFIFANYTYMLLGLVLFRKVLLKLFNHKIAGLLIIIIALGTNYFNIHLSGLGMSHVFLFPLYAGTIYYTLKWYEEFKNLHLIICGFCITLIILVRPVDGLIILIPILWGVSSFKIFIDRIKLFWAHRKVILGTLFVGIVILSTQLIYFKITSGSFFMNGYANPEESLYLDAPNILDFLLSWRKGWLIYTPIMLLFIVGIFVLRKKNKGQFIPILIFSLVFIYVSASWSTWWYGYSFSQRTMIQTYPLLAIPIGALLTHTMTKAFYTFLLSSVVTAFLILNIFQTYQFKTGVLHGSRMTYAAYCHIFGHLDYNKDIEKLLIIDHDNASFNYQDNSKRDYFLSHSQEISCLNNEVEYSNSLEIPYYRTSEKYYAWYAVEFDYQIPPSANENMPLLVCRFWQKNRCYGAQQFPVTTCPNFEKGKWCHAKFMYLTPTIRDSEDKFECFVWGRNEEIMVDNLKMTSYVPKD